MAQPFRVLIVDRENTAGGPLGERLLRKHLSLRGVPDEVVSVSSAGFAAFDGRPLEPPVAQVLARYGADAGVHLSRRLTGPLVAAADLILVGSRPDFDAVVAAHPFARSRTFRLSEIALVDEQPIVIAPLAEQPRRLNELRATLDISDAYDAHPPTTEEELLALADTLDEDAAWIAGVWSAIVPRAGGDAHTLPASVGVIVDLPLSAIGVPVLVRCTGSGADDLAAAVTWAWSRCVRTDGEPAEVEIEATLESDPAALAVARARGAIAYPDVEHVLHFLASAVTVRAIEARAGDLLMFHAAGLASADGDVVGFVAPSGVGKTTLARTLARHDSYVTDETLAVTLQGEVLPYPKPLSLTVDERSGLKQQRGADSLGLRHAPEQLRLTRLVLLDRREDAPEAPLLEQLEILDGLAQVAPQVSHLARLPRKLHTLADAVEAVGGVSRLTYRDALSVLPLLDDMRSGAP